MKSLYRICLVCFAAFYVATQSLTLVHAAQYGQSGHIHDGVVCEVAPISSEQEISLPPVPQKLMFPIALISPCPVIVPMDFRTPPGRAPPARGPPLSSV